MVVQVIIQAEEEVQKNSMENNKDLIINQKGVIVQVLVVILLLAGIIAGYFLLKNPQIFRSRATNPPIVAKDINGNALPEASGIPQTTNTKIKLELTSPLGPAQSLPSPSASSSPSPSASPGT